MPAATTLNVAGFSGLIVTETTYPDGGHWHQGETMHGLLQKGKVFMHVSYTVSAIGCAIYDVDKDNKVHLVYDGTDDAKAALARMVSEAMGMLRGVRLQPAP